MDAEKEGNKEKTQEEEYSIHKMMRRMMLAGIGAMALQHDKMEEHINKLVERGETAKKDREKFFEEMRERHKKHLHGEESFAHKRISEVMDHFDVPTKKDFDDLNQKLSTLEHKIDELTKSKK